MIKQLFNKITVQEKKDATELIFTQSSPSTNFFLMIILSVLMASFGLITNNPTVIIGSMMIAPILYPILGFAMSIVMFDFGLMHHSFVTTLKAIFLSILSSSVISFLLFPQSSGYTEEILSRIDSSLFSCLIGVIAGLAAAFAVVKPKLNETLPGVALSVSLVPPLAVAGIALSRLDFDSMLGALILFSVNIIGVIVAAAIIFLFMNFYSQREVAEQTVEVENKIIELDKKLEEEKMEIV